MNATSKSNNPGAGASGGHDRGWWSRLSRRAAAFTGALRRPGATRRAAALGALFVVGTGIGLLVRGPLAPSLQGPARMTGTEQASLGSLEAARPQPGAVGETGSSAGSLAPPSRPAGASTQGAQPQGLALPGELVWPADGMVVATAGWRRNPDRGDWTYLPGIELAVGSSSAIRAAADGTVASVDAGSGEFSVSIDHGQGWVTIYGGLSRVRVQPGQRVQRGAVIGYGPRLPEAMPALAGAYGVGGAAGAEEAGSSVRAVVSFSVRHGTESVNPLSVMPAASYRVAPADEPATGTQPTTAQASASSDGLDEAPSPVGP
ncbi:M23 family metallopeptidase [Carboxydochorda subterranea]|uniref:M23 family metallopeptidase n=1 Tax=Carboxydichorda subterranea TaxID=3109565 RepID=A0ABZ1BVV9_9FIRM|nr:M23 family metallopeptidase [Limnochorda sp. L945t]WRP16924.1 M23 family metallopeptidase [Limnochorda sp. L945t]